MNSQSSWPQSDILSKCFILVRWLHEHGVAWSGTPPELSLHVATYCEGTPFFRNGDELVKFIQINADMLRDLGLDSYVETVAGRTVVDLKITSPGTSSEQRTPDAVASQLAAIQASIERQQSLSPANEQPSAIEASLISHIAPEQLANRLQDLNGANDSGVADRSTKVNAKQMQASAKASSRSGALSKGSSISLIAVVLALAMLLFAFARPRTPSAPAAASSPTAEKTELPAPVTKAETPASTQASPATTASPAQVTPAPAPIATPPAENVAAPAEKLDPAERKNFEAALAQASTTRSSSSQYDVGMRYAQGFGVLRDNSAAFAWLTLADTNGSLEAASALQTLTPQLSVDELQRARVLLANAFIAGVIVPKNYVSAYRLLLQAEQGGSADAATIKKELEVRMPVWQIVQAGGQPPKRDPNKK